MADATVIGSQTFVKGRIEGSGDLEIAGRVEGEVSVSGEITVEKSGLVSANLTAERLVIHGAVKGDLSASDSIVLEAGARVVGDVKAARVSIAPGALVRGYVETSASGGARVSSKKAVSAKHEAPKASAAPAKVVAAPVKAPAKSAPKAAPVAAKAIAKKPPQPVVAALKKGAKAVHKKRA